MFILQPDLRKPEVLPASPSDANLEARGFVEVDISANSSSNSARILVNPQIRGTFLSGSMPPDFDQQAYSLLTPNGGSLLTI
ncbi:MAG: hypothetical protein HC925_07770 [Coleofasciculaceae cyanobacterium SM2_3_26]|nr:hypothetical protein [Coleofasciculaceae cyanobacterium SM2_3_26]